MTGHGARSLHARVGVMFAVGGLLLAVVLGISTAVLVYPVMMDQRARTTERQVEINSRIVGQVLRDAPSGVADTLRSLDRPIPSYSLVATDGRWYASRVTADAADLPADLRAAALDGQRATRRVQLAAGPSLVAVRPLAGGAAGYVEVFPPARHRRHHAGRGAGAAPRGHSDNRGRGGPRALGGAFGAAAGGGVDRRRGCGRRR
ncbi:hypothetical protein [Paractinoplanes rishiriensis]|uniref:Uncharacterized protein n=1 Tax=Paractinoplanes rishiriensis TaxID=1050105 RepID=A0A919K9C8_9ACTN|nr:hypothetical protein [Actinoplanes rishiriensis]GIF01231.1 hypothetical protein Ari01nite_86950 [Actinoplanes rishiriensis]